MSDTIDDLVELAVNAAVEARGRAYAPYSGFTMGAAAVSRERDVVRGTLVENVSLGLAICSERVALFSAVTEKVTPAVLAVCSKRTGDALTFPCGACLQVALEIGGPDLLVVAVDPDGVTERAVLSDLLPRAPKIHSPSSVDDA
jgi:cytidine deaminase